MVPQINRLVNEARDAVLVLRDAVQMGSDWDMDWQIDQLNHALDLIEMVRPASVVERVKYETRVEY